MMVFIAAAEEPWAAAAAVATPSHESPGYLELQGARESRIESDSESRSDATACQGPHAPG